MGCSRSAIADDENDWHEFKVKAGLTNVGWDCYSTNAMYAIKGYMQLNLKGSLLKEFVTLLNARDAVQQAEKLEQEERELYEKLKAKFN